MTLAVQWLIPQNSVAAADVNHAIVNVILDEPLSLPEINPQIFPTSESREARYKISKIFFFSLMDNTSCINIVLSPYWNEYF